MNLENFLEDKIISRRTYNVLTYSNLSTIETLLNEVRVRGGINKLKLVSAGKGTKIEIEKLIILIIGTTPASESVANSNRLYQPSIMDGLSELQVRLLDRKIKIFFEALHQKSKNAISSFLQEDLSSENILQKIFSQVQFKINTLHSVGKRLEEDIESFLMRIVVERHFIVKTGNDILLENQISEEYTFSNTFYKPYLMINLSKLQISLLDKKIKIFFEKLSQRSKNAINIFLQKDLSFENIFRKIFSQIQFKISSLSNVGKKSEEEVVFFLARIVLEHHFTVEAGNDVLSEKQNYIELELLFDINYKDIEKYSLIDGGNKIKLVKLVEVYLFYKNPDERFNVICNYLFTKKNKEVSMTTVANQLNVTRERVRQIINKFDEIIDEKLAVFNQIDSSLYSIYISDTSDFLSINLVFCNRINKKENTQFSQKFLGFFFAYLHKEKYILFPNDIEDSENYYLIDKLLFSVFKFKDFYNEIKNIINASIKEDFEIDLSDFAHKYITKSEKVVENINRIIPILEEILLQEFSPKLTVTDGIVMIKRNTRVSLQDILMEILTTLGEPSNIEDIIKQGAIQFDNLQLTQSNIRVLLREKHLFNYYGRSSTYGLVKWEKENDNLKSGTMRDIIELFLMQQSIPIHISEIIDYITKYRKNITERSIYSSLYADEDRFINFKFGFWGSCSNNYQEFKPNRPHKLFKNEIVKIIKKDKLTYAQVVDFFANRDKLLPIQTQVILDRMIKSSILYIENNILHYSIL